MANELQGRRVAFLAADGVERVELDEPRRALDDAGATTTVVSIHDGEIQSMRGDIEPVGRIPVDRVVGDVSIEDFDALVLPGGTVNPDALRIRPEAVAFVRAFYDSGKPIGAICHGPWTLMEAGVVNGKRMTAWESVRHDLRDHGANVVDEEVVVDDGIITSRRPDDIPAFNARLIEIFARAPQGARAVAAA